MGLQKKTTLGRPEKQYSGKVLMVIMVLGKSMIFPQHFRQQ